MTEPRHRACGSCGHVHTGPEAAGICIGCPCGGDVVTGRESFVTAGAKASEAAS